MNNRKNMTIRIASNRKFAKDRGETVNEYLEYRRRAVCQLRLQGLTYKEIGLKFRISLQRVRQIFFNAKQRGEPYATL